MNYRHFLFFLVLLLSGPVAIALPSTPTNIAAEPLGNAVKISWEYPAQEGIFFNVYRGQSLENGKIIATVQENFFIDKNALAGKEYIYFVNAQDANGKSPLTGMVSITPLSQQEKPFTITLIEPLKKIIDLETNKKIDFVLAIESERFEQLQDLKAILINDELGIAKEFSLDSNKRLFTLSIDLPEKMSGEVFQTTYLIQVTATIDNQQFSETIEANLGLVPKRTSQFEISFDKLIPVLVLLFAAAPITLFLWRRSLHEKFRKEMLWWDKELIKKELDQIWQSYCHRQMDLDDYNEKKDELIANQKAVEKEIKTGKKTEENPVKNLNMTEINEIKRIIMSYGKQPKEGETFYTLKGKLIHAGHDKKIAKKATQIIFQKKQP